MSTFDLAAAATDQRPPAQPRPVAPAPPVAPARPRRTSTGIPLSSPEAKLLACFLRDPSKIGAIGFSTADCEHEGIATAITAIDELHCDGDTPPSGHTVDLDTVVAKAAHRAINFDALVDVAGLTPTGELAAHYAGRVREAAQRRRLAESCSKALERLGDPDADVAEIKAALDSDRAEIDQRAAVAADWRSRCLDFATVNPEPMRWLVDGLIPAGQATVVAAEEKGLKSWLVKHIGLTVVRGGRVLDRWPCHSPGRVLIVSPEGGLLSFTRRMYGLCWGEQIDPAEVGEHLLLYRDRLDLTNQRSCALFQAAINGFQPSLIIVDPLISVIGGRDDNSAGDLQPCLDRLRDFIPPGSDAAILVCHHHNKATERRPLAHRVRGTSAIAAWLDCLISLQRADPDDPSSAVRLEVPRMRDGPGASPAGFSLQVGFEGVPERFRQRGLCSFRLAPCDAPEVVAPGRRAGARSPEVQGELAELLDAVRTAPGLSISGYAQSLNWEGTKAKRRAKDLEAAGLISKRRGELNRGAVALYPTSTDSRPQPTDVTE